jgi:hypothetical protein
LACSTRARFASLSSATRLSTACQSL